MQTKNAIGNLIRRYQAVLNKCNILNNISILTLTAGLLLSPMLISDVNAVYINPSGNNVASMDATDGSEQIIQPASDVFNDPTLVNEGTIFGGRQYSVSNNINVWAGMYGRSANIGYNFTNIGDITVKQNYDDIFGMYTYAAQVGHTLTNIGTMTVSGNDYIYGMFASAGFNSNHTLTNIGTITVSGNNSVYGMYVANGSNAHNLSNIGHINVTASAINGRAYEAYGNATGYNVDTWATTLRTWSANDTVFGAGVGKIVNFNNSRLIFRPGTEAQGFYLGKEYQIAHMVAIGGAGGTMELQSTINGTISSIESEVPFLTVIRGGTAQAPTVRLESNVSESTTPGIASVQQALPQIQAHFNHISSALRNVLVRVYRQANLTTSLNSGSELTSENKWQVFLNPYVLSINNSDLDFSGNNVGITGGFNYYADEQLSLGAHLDFNAGTFHGDIMDTYSKSTSLALGVHASYNISDEWYARAQFTTSINQSNNSYTNDTALPMTANAIVNNTALNTAISTGYIWDFGQGHSLNSEIGLSYMNLHTYAYDINWFSPATTASLYDLSYDDGNYSAFYATLNFDWRSEFEIDENNNLALLAGIGVRQKLNANDIETNVQTLGSRYTTRITEDPTTFLANVGAEWKIDDFSITLQYNGEYGNAQTTHGGSVMLKLEF